MNTVANDSHLPRKFFHVASGLIIPTLYYFEPLPRVWTLYGVAAAFVIWITLEIVRLRSASANKIFLRFFSRLMKKREAENFTSVSFMLGGALLSMLLFEEKLAAIVIYFIAIGDPIAAVIGKSFGKIRYQNGRSLEGSIAMFAVCLVIGLTLGELTVAIATSGAMVAAVAEAFSGRIDDNLTVPFLAGAAITALS